MSDLRHAAPATADAQAMQVADLTQPSETRHDSGAGRLVSCHMVCACLYLSEADMALPSLARRSGWRRKRVAPRHDSRPIDGLFRPPRLPALA